MAGLVNNYIIPDMGSRPLSSIKPTDIVRLLNTGVNMSESHNKKLLLVIRQIFDTAEENDLIGKSPARRAKVSQSKKKFLGEQLQTSSET